jgi:cell division septal protein FtsQ
VRTRQAIALLVIGLVAAAGYEAVKKSQLFAVRHVTVEGAPSATAAMVRRRVDQVIGTESLLAVDPQRVANAVAGLPSVRRVYVDRAFPNELRIHVTPEVPVATIATLSGKYAIGASGRVIGPAGRGSLPLLVVPAGTILPPPGAVIPSTLDDELHVAVGVHGLKGMALRSIRVSDLGISAMTRKGMLLELGTGAALDQKLAIAGAILAQRPDDNATGVPVALRYVDVSMPDHPVYRTLQGDPGTANGTPPQGTPGAEVPSGPAGELAAAIASLFDPGTVSTST